MAVRVTYPFIDNLDRRCSRTWRSRVARIVLAEPQFGCMAGFTRISSGS